MLQIAAMSLALRFQLPLAAASTYGELPVAIAFGDPAAGLDDRRGVLRRIAHGGFPPKVEALCEVLCDWPPEAAGGGQGEGAEPG